MLTACAREIHIDLVSPLAEELGLGSRPRWVEQGTSWQENTCDLELVGSKKRNGPRTVVGGGVSDWLHC